MSIYQMCIIALKPWTPMHKCAYPGCNIQIEKKYRFCYAHSNAKYESCCKIHGKTIFIRGKCQKCEAMKKPLYEVTSRGNKYYDRYGKHIGKTHLLYPYLNRVTHKRRNTQDKYMGNITAVPGIYGIFVRDGNSLSKCLYVGQSVNVKNRVHQHRECFKTAKRHILGIRMHKQRLHLNKLKKYKTEYKYYQMANNYTLAQLKFVKLVGIPKRYNLNELSELLTYCEQAMIDTYKPKFNTFAARPSTRS